MLVYSRVGDKIMDTLPKYRFFGAKKYMKALGRLYGKEAKEHALAARREGFIPRVVLYKGHDGKMWYALYIRASRSLLYMAGRE